MKGIINLLKALIETIESILNFAWNLIKGLLQLIQLIPKGVSMLSNSIGVLPSILVAFAAATITISVIFIIVGRSPGGKN